MATPEHHPAIPDPKIERWVDRYACDVRPLKGKSDRSDVIVHIPTMTAALQAPDFVATMRRFFLEMDAEIDRYVNDPVATAQALARVEALLADVRYVRNRLQQVTAEALDTERMRRLTVEGVVTVEAATEMKRSEWQHERLLTDLLARHGFDRGVVSPVSGERIDLVDFVAMLLNWFRPEWRLTGIRESLLNPDNYCTVERDDNDQPVRTPTVRIVDNRARGHR